MEKPPQQMMSNEEYSGWLQDQSSTDSDKSLEKRQRENKINTVNSFLNNPTPTINDVASVRFLLRDDFIKVCEQKQVENPLYEIDFDTPTGFNELKEAIRRHFPNIYN